MNLHRSLSFLALLLVTISPLATSQQSAMHAFAIDATVGVSTGLTGEFVDNTALAFELTVAAAHEGGAFAALTVGGRDRIASGDVCRISSDPHQHCVPSFPDFKHVGVLAGAEGDMKPVRFRALVGPAFYGGDGASGLGVQLHFDAAVGGESVALVAAARGSAIGRFDGERFVAGSLEFGLRIR